MCTFVPPNLLALIIKFVSDRKAEQLSEYMKQWKKQQEKKETNK